MKLSHLFTITALCVLNAVLPISFTRGEEPSYSSENASMDATSADQQLFFCTTFIQARSFDNKRAGAGTGFIVVEPIGEKGELLFIVTCKHVVSGYDIAKFTFVQATENHKPDLGKKCEIEVALKNLAYENPDPQIDVAIIPLFPILDRLHQQGQSPFFRALDRKLVPDKRAEDDLSTIQPILFLGYPRGLRDEANMLPIARRGVTATPYVVDFNKLPAFLIDASVFPGSSGSPVMVFDQGAFTTKSGLSGGTRAYFLGMISQAYLWNQEGIVEFKPLPSQFVPIYKETQFMNIGAALKARVIFDTIDGFKRKYLPLDQQGFSISSPSPTPEQPK